MPNLSEILIALKFQGARNIIRAVSYSIRRDWMNIIYLILLTIIYLADLLNEVIRDLVKKYKARVTARR